MDLLLWLQMWGSTVPFSEKKIVITMEKTYLIKESSRPKSCRYVRTEKEV